MNWAEAAEDYATDHHTYEHLGYDENMRFHKMFAKGAEWQRGQITECFNNHPDPRCEEHPDGDPISCGWKSAYISIMNYLEG